MSRAEGRSLREEFDALASAENSIESDEEYTFGDLRDEAQDYTALTVLGGAVKIDEDEETLYIHEDSLDYGLEMESIRRTNASEPYMRELGLLGAGVLGFASSAWKLIEGGGGPEYLATGAFSALLSQSAFRRLRNINSAKIANEKAGEQLDISSYIESYELETVGDEEVREMLEQGQEDQQAVHAYTADELEDVDPREL